MLATIYLCNLHMNIFFFIDGILGLFLHHNGFECFLIKFVENQLKS